MPINCIRKFANRKEVTLLNPNRPMARRKRRDEEIVKAGYANLMTVPQNVRYQERFLEAYREARENRRELWK
jgi:endonuclease YncB( thermonuclease family)